MIRINTLLGSVAGFVAGVIFVLSCGDGDSPDPADAAVPCDCPAAEPPLAGRIVRVISRREIAGMTLAGWSAQCELEDIVLGGGCYFASGDPKFTLSSSTPAPTDGQSVPFAWYCEVYNGTPNPINASAHAICLKPAK